MAEDAKKGRPTDGPSRSDNPRTSVVPPTDDWALIARGWSNGTLPALGSPAWRTLPDNDPVKVGTVVAARLGVLDLVNAHGPAYARLCVMNELEAA